MINIIVYINNIVNQIILYGSIVCVVCMCVVQCIQCICQVAVLNVFLTVGC